MNRQGMSVVFGILVLLCLSSCGGGSGLGFIVGEGGIGGTGATAGPITGFGSVFVNGIEFSTANAEISFNGRTVSQSALKIGMQVSVNGPIDGNSGRAERIYYYSDLEGPIERINRRTGELTVLGRRVMVDNLTVIEDQSRLDGLALGDVVIISGLPDADNVLHATWLAKNPNSTTFRIIGEINSLNMAERTFEIGDLPIDYGSPNVIDTAANLSNGLNVVVEGLLNEGVLEAASIRSLTENIQPRNNDRLEISGFITRFGATSNFDVAGIRATTSPATTFIYGNANDLQNNIRVEAEGVINDNGILDVSRLWFRDISSFRTGAGEIVVIGNVDAINRNNRKLTVLGVDFEITRNTQFRDRLTELTSFSLADLSIGDGVILWGFRLLGENRLIVERLTRTQPSAANTTRLQGPVDNANVDARTLTLLGITVMATDATIYRRVDGISTTADAFFSSLTEGTSMVESRGQFAGGILSAEELLVRE